MDLEEALDVFSKPEGIRQGVGPEGLTPLGFGVSRVVFRIEFGTHAGDVVKVARTDSARRQNQKEHQTWMDAKSQGFEHLFAPITHISDDGSYLIMRYAEPADFKKSSNFARRVEEETDIIVSDTTPNNIGNLNGKQVFIDYPWGRLT